MVQGEALDADLDARDEAGDWTDMSVRGYRPAASDARAQAAAWSSPRTPRADAADLPAAAASPPGAAVRGRGQAPDSNRRLGSAEPW